jgi:hypothetical protein
MTPRIHASLGATLLLVLTAATAVGCPREDDAACPACSDPEIRGTVESPALDELSGIAASGRHDDVLWAHNDSGDTPRIFALSAAGAHLASYTLAGAAHEDWEDIAQAPCDAGQCLYVGDIGDNDRQRSSYAIYVVVEPEAIEPGNHELPVERVEFGYPDGSHDAETLLVHPRTGVVTIVTKAEDGPASVYELPSLASGDALVARFVGELDPPEGSARITAGAVHPDATGVLLRTNERLFHWALASDQTVADALAGPGCELPLASEDQGEAVTWQAGAIVTIGEGLNPPINVSDCGAS